LRLGGAPIVLRTLLDANLAASASFNIVLRGLGPRIHDFVRAPQSVDGRVKPGQSDP
jgi:hypothetical protein